MRQPRSVIWGIIKKRNCWLSKWQGNEWSAHPSNMTGFNCASQFQNTVAVGVTREKSAKGFRRVFTLATAHKPRHHQKVRKGSHNNVSFNSTPIRKEVNHAAKTIQGLTFQNDRMKKQALRKLARLSASTQSTLTGTVAKK